MTRWNNKGSARSRSKVQRATIRGLKGTHPVASVDSPGASCELRYRRPAEMPP